MNFAPLLFALIATSAAPEAREPVLLDFHATWCGPCQQTVPEVKQLIARGYPVKKIDIDQKPELAQRYKVDGVPTFIVVDASGRELARVVGPRPAAELARVYREARTKALADRADDSDPEAEAEEAVEPGPADDAPAEEDAHEAEPAPQEDRRPAAANPDPWKTVVRIKVHGNGTIGFGSGTIVHSTAEESIILTCAHIFKLDGRQQKPPAQFPLPITVDLFDGTLHSNTRSEKTPQVHYVESHRGQAIDYDFNRDVGLIRIKPGRKLPASRVVPPSWAAAPGMKMTAVGCSEGNDATAWSTRIIKPGVQLFRNSAYEATECEYAPKQGRSGGGLYDPKGYLAGVCDFAEPRGNHGFYASPRSIYHILDRNNLMALYSPTNRPKSGALLAAGQPDPRRGRPSSIARAQSPDADDQGEITMPPPQSLGIRTPNVAQGSVSRKATGRGSWQPVAHGDEGQPERAEMMIAPDADNDRFYQSPQRPPTAPRNEPAPARGSQARSKSKWRAVGSTSSDR